MKKLWVAYCTEYEQGWGSRPDGLILAISKDVIDTEIKESNKQGSIEYYWRYSTPEEISCDNDTWEKISNDFKKGLYHSLLNSLKDIGVFYKQV